MKQINFFLRLSSGVLRKMMWTLSLLVLLAGWKAEARTTVVDVVVNSPNHTTLEAAVIAANLAGTLSGDGPFTVFAPTDAAFAALPAGTIPALLADPSGALTDILKYHVLAGSVKSTDLTDWMKAKTLLGTNIVVNMNSKGVFINNAKVTVADVMTDNGVVHVIDAVLLPAEPSSVWDIISSGPNLETLETVVKAAKLDGALSGAGTLTVFAPTDKAFAALPSEVVQALLSDPSGELTSILLTHVMGLKYMAADLSDKMSILTLSYKRVEITITPSGVFVNGVKVILTDLKAANGVVHIIDAVIIPPRDVKISENSKFGKVLTDSRGNTLYFSSLDASGKSTCTGTCYHNWPPFYADILFLPEGLNKSDFATGYDAFGQRQTTYKGWPLYYHAGDGKPGDINGDGKDMVWFVAKPDYSIMLVNNQLKGNDGINYKGNYKPGNEVIQYFTDGYGRTLYTWSKDFYNTNKYTKSDFSNNATWPVYEQTGIVLPSILDKSLFGVTNVYGRKQMTYNGWPLYYFGADGNTRGNNKGVSVPTPGIWPVAVQKLTAPIPATVVDVVVNSASHNTLEAAVLAAGLAGTLSGTGPFTLFAPTDNAFAALPAGTVEALLADPKGLLTQILTYHVAGINAKSTDLSNGMYVKTLQGKEVKVTINAQGVFINNAIVTVADIVTGNGVVHVIDAVLTIPAVTVVDIIARSDSHNTLEAAVTAAGLVPVLSGTGPFTVFAPTDAAFNALPAGTVEALLVDPSGALATILKYHVLGANVLSSSLANGMTVTTVLGKDIKVTINAQGVFINNAKVTVADLKADNGVVHVIDAVILPPKTVMDVVEESANHNTLEEAIKAAGLNGALNTSGPFTVFAPTDAAFAALPAGTIPALLADPSGALTDILKYHVLAGKVKSTDLSNGLTAKTLLGKDIKVTINAQGVFINNAKVTVADIMTDNGVVHVIDAVLLPPRVTVVDVVVNSPNHTTLEAAVIAANLAGTLSGEGPFTVFAPTDAAFAALPAGTIPALLADPSGALTDILKYHVLAGKVKSTDLSNGMSATTLLGKDIKVTINAQGVFINNAKVTVADIMTDNGVVHVIDAVLLPPRVTVVDVVVNSPNHTTLEAAVIAANLAGTLSGEGPFTVFAPTDAAFAALPAGTIPALLADPSGALTDILKYHVLAGKVKSTDLSNGMSATTLLGKDIKVTINAQGVFINNAKVTVADIMTDNGVVHVIDAVLLPPRVTVVDVVVNSPNHTTLEAAVIAANLAGTLSGEGPFTVFAPTDAAFAALPAGTIPALLADPSGALTDILKYHVLAGKVKSTDLSNGMSATTLLGKDIKVTINAQGVFINNAKVTVADIMTDNGVVHVIDAVLIPQPVTSAKSLSAMESQFRLYPNPATSNVSMEFETGMDNSGSTVSILGLDGRKVTEIPVNGSKISYNLNGLRSGIYMVVFKKGNNIQTQKLIVK